MTVPTLDRVRKSEKLSKEDFSAFVKWVNDQPTKIDAALIIGITRPTLDRILAVKSGRPDNIEKIKGVIGLQNNTPAA